MNFKVIAVDFDGTLCENKWPEIGEPNDEVIEHLKNEKKKGAKIILWTCRTKDELANAIDWCKQHGLEFDAVNKNVKEAIDSFGEDTRKVFANEYIDDRMLSMFKFPDNSMNVKSEVLYLCNRKQCGEKCSFPECRHTTRIEYAANFNKDQRKSFYIERECQ